MLEQRIEFVVLARQGERTVADLCRQFGISRQTAYTWLRRYEAGGVAEMKERSRRPIHSPKQTGSEIAEQLVKWRNERPDWGAPKLLYQLKQQWPECRISERTVHRILQRRGLIQNPGKNRPATRRFERSRPNELWQMDFKGPQGFNTGSPVGPLLIQDDHSRFLIVLKHLGSTKAEGVQKTLKEAFEQFGVPEAMLMDHGTPWWNAASPWGLTELSIWLMQQGIRVIHSGIRHPQTQGKVERTGGAFQQAVSCRHRDAEDQRWLDLFRHEYNVLRPHEGIGMVPPCTRWVRSDRQFQPSPSDWQYPSSMEPVRLQGAGQLYWRKHRWEISGAMRNQLVGIQVIDLRALVFYCNTPIRELDLTTGRALPIPINALGSLQKRNRVVL